MMREMEYPCTRMPRILNHMMDQSNQNLINAVFGAMVAVRTTYLPTENLPKFMQDVANFFLKKAAKEQENSSLQNFCIEKALSFIIDQANLNTVANWVHSDKITYEGVELKSALTPDHKYQILSHYYASKDFSLDDKEKLKTKVFENDTSDKG